MYFTFGGYKKFLDPLFSIYSSSVQAFLNYKHLHISAQQILGPSSNLVYSFFLLLNSAKPLAPKMS